MKRVTLLLLCSLFLFSFSCEDEEPLCSGEFSQITSEKLTEEGANNNCQLQNINGNQREEDSQVDLIIQSQADYEKYGLCSNSLPFINFSQKTLLAGRYIARNNDYVKSQRVYQNCNSKIIFEVILARGDATIVTDVDYFAIIPKISSSTNIVVDVRYE